MHVERTSASAESQHRAGSETKNHHIVSLEERCAARKGKPAAIPSDASSIANAGAAIIAEDYQSAIVGLADFARLAERSGMALAWFIDILNEDKESLAEIVKGGWREFFSELMQALIGWLECRQIPEGQEYLAMVEREEEKVDADQIN
jgi:hypothetical protein